MVAPKEGLTSKLHVVYDKQGRPVRLHLSQGQCGDFTGADLLLRDLPDATTLMGDKGYDSDKIRTRLLEQGITPASPPDGTATRGSLPARGCTRWA
ncbi:MAG: transposase, partial [Synechococcus sp. SB0664_bin_36]|nr:transposase [Synechococcus sp. SB0664_bin_36]